VRVDSLLDFESTHLIVEKRRMNESINWNLTRSPPMELFQDIVTLLGLSLFSISGIHSISEK